MLSTINNWLPWILLTCIPAFFNLIVSIPDFLQCTRQLPFFSPLRHLGFWVWCLFQLLLPAIFFWFIFLINQKPQIDFSLCIKAGLFGVAFVAIINCSTKIGSIGLSIKPFYTALTGIAINMILSQEAERTTSFWTTLEKELNSGNVDLESVLIYLNSYIESSATFDNLLKDEQRDKLTTEYKELLEKAKGKSLTHEKNQAIVNVIKQVLRNHDLPKALQKVGCTKTYDQYYKKTGSDM